jgi:threonine/homoserine/homoserine lactone efflux protein
VFAGALTASQLFAFSALALLITLLPGPDTALVIRASLISGRLGAIKAAAGICTELLMWGGLTAGGLTAFLASFPKAYRVITLLGGVYLLYLGWQSWKSARQRDGELARSLGSSPYVSGLLTNLLNPKIAHLGDDSCNLRNVLVYHRCSALPRFFSLPWV